MKIIHAHKYYYYRRGAERYMLDLMQMQEEKGNEVAPFCMHYPKNLTSQWDDFFVSEVQTEQGSHGLFNMIKQVGRALWSLEAKHKFESLIDSFEPNVVHIHNIYTHISPSILKVCEKRSIPVVMTVHDYSLVSADYALWDPVKKQQIEIGKAGLLRTARTRFIKGLFFATLVLEAIQIWQRFWKQYSGRIDLFLANSKFTASILSGANFNKNKIKVLYPFIQIPKHVTYKDCGYVLYVGALEDYKGVQILVEAMKSYPNIKLKIAGSGPFESNLRELAIGMKNIEFIGFVQGEYKKKLISEARVCVVPSLWNEPFGLTAVDAMAHMTAVLVSDSGGLSEIVEDGVSGEKFKKGDIKDLKKMLKKFIDDPEYSKSLAKAGRDRAIRMCDPQKHYEDLMDYYEQVISG
jgi:glycosyltransferase involved in cell wall biosynthesis